MSRRYKRINIKAEEKKNAFLAARRVRLVLENAEVDILRGEFVRLDKRLYLDVDAADLPGMHELEEAAGIDAIVSMEDIAQPSTEDECLNCGNIADGPIVECPSCGFQEIAHCPHCNGSIARAGYLEAGGFNLFECPSCHNRVRLAFNEPLILDDGHYRQPVVLVTPAAAVAGA